MKHHRFGELSEQIYANNLLQVHEQLAENYRDELRTIDRYEDACEKNTNSSTGGQDEERTHNAFVYRFCASVCRSGYLLLDNRRRLEPVSQQLLSQLTDGRLAILDVPCGSAAGILGLLSLIATLRKNGNIPQLPLCVEITAGDFSETARGLYEKMMQRAATWLADDGIYISWTSHEWDAADQYSTSEIVDNWLNNASNLRRFRRIGSGFFRRCGEQLQEV